MTDNSKPKEVNSYGITCSLLYISVISVVGLPLWWTTTSPSRHSLPDISALLVKSQTIAHKLAVTVVTIDDRIDKEELRSELSHNYPTRFSGDGHLAYEYEWKVRQPLTKEQLIFSQKSLTLTDIDNELQRLEGHQTKGKLWLFVLGHDSNLIDDHNGYVLGKNRFFYVKNNAKHFGQKSLTEVVVDLVESSLLLSDNSYNSQRIDFLVYPNIDLIVNVVNEVDDDQTRDLLSERVDEIHRIGDIGLIKESGVSELIRFNLNSQVLHYVFTERFISSHTLTTNGTNERLFDVNKVPLLMNTIESRVVEHNNKQSYHLLVYVPKDKDLYFYEPKTETKSNLMVTPFRGGVVVWNKRNDFVNGFRSIIRNLIGLPDNIPPHVIKNDLFFSHWELDAIRRAITQKQILKSLSSLESISKLIVKVSNIVIIEEISQRMHTSVDLSIQAIDALSTADLNNAYKLSTKGYMSSETAFFDPSLLSLLYFPDDQKYAVYFPLFLPVSLPVLTSAYHLYKTLVGHKH